MASFISENNFFYCFFNEFSDKHLRLYHYKKQIKLTIRISEYSWP